MKIKDSYPVFVTNQLTLTRDYYINWFEFSVFFESSYFILLEAKGDKSYYIAFMDEKHPTSPPKLPVINSNSGVFLTLEIQNAKAEFEKLTAAGLNIYYPLKEEVWGQHRFGLIDPNGMYIDIVEQTTPQEGYWEQYMSNSH